MDGEAVQGTSGAHALVRTLVGGDVSVCLANPGTSEMHIVAALDIVEDLRSMDAKGMGRTMNTCRPQQARGQIIERMRHLAAEAGIAGVTFPALTTTPGWKWALAATTGPGGASPRGA